MARTSGTSARVQRLIALCATALLGVATAAAFGRVFSGPGVTMKLLLTGLASAGIATLVERRSLLLATVVSTASMLLVVSWTVFPETTWFGLPTYDTLSAAASSAAQVGEQARVQVAPTAPLQPLLLAAVTAVWAAIFSAHALAFRAGSPLLALLPPVALVAFADTVLEELVRPQYGVLFLIAGLAVVFSDGLRRIQGWGPVWATHGSEGRLYRDAGRSARKVALMAVVAAIFAPILVPGFGSAGLIDLSTVNEDQRIALSPLVSIASELKRSQPFEVFRVRTARPTYHRMIALTDFNGSTWAPPRDQQGSAVEGDELLPAGVAGGVRVEQTYTISRGTRYPWLPVAYAPESVQVDRSLRMDRVSTTIWLNEFLDAGDTYTTSSRLVAPTSEQLDQVQFSTTARTEAAVRLPADLSPQIETIADRWTEGAPNTYREILAIQDRLRDQSRFTYSTRVPARGDSFTIADFLTVTRRGFCQQFASAMAVLLRSRGIPARVVVGFTQGTPIPGEEGTYRVTTDHYHSWVEVRFPIYGWLAFEPTPTRSNPVAAPYLTPGEPCEGEECDDTSTGSPGIQGAAPIFLPNGGTLADLVQAPRRASLRELGGSPGASGLDEPTGPTARTWFAAGVLVVLMILAATPLFRAWRRRRRLRRAGPAPRSLILAHYDVFTERAGDLGWARAPAETPDEYRRKVAESGTISDGDLDRLTSLTVSAAYGAAEPDDDDVATARQAAATTLRDLRRSTPPMKRVTGLYLRRD
jgi:transglutaminase-like putative cysteine protease